MLSVLVNKKNHFLFSKQTFYIIDVKTFIPAVLVYYIFILLRCLHLYFFIKVQYLVLHVFLQIAHVLLFFINGCLLVYRYLLVRALACCVYIFGIQAYTYVHAHFISAPCALSIFFYKYFAYMYFIESWFLQFFVRTNFEYIRTPTKHGISTVIRSPHIDKRGREQFAYSLHRRHMCIPYFVSSFFPQLVQFDAGILYIGMHTLFVPLFGTCSVHFHVV